MIQHRDTTIKPTRIGLSLTAKLVCVLLLASSIVLLIGGAGWWILHSTRDEIASFTAASPTAIASQVEVFLTHVDEASIWLFIVSIFGLFGLVGLFFYLIHAVVRPVQMHARIMSRLAVGDSSAQLPPGQLARNDEIGDLARALHGVSEYQRGEVTIANAMAGGDFSHPVIVRDSADKLGLAIKQMASITTETLRQVNAHVTQVMRGCETIASASQELTANTSGITTAVSQITSGISEIGAHADDNAGMAGQVGEMAATGVNFIERGYEDIGEMGVVMLNMQACGDKIVGIAKSIGDIAFQTNLLALNASVEAARAGRHGKGFTIVAEEVRRLASRTSKAAEETSTLMKDTVEQVELAAAIGGRINATFADMQTNLQESEALMQKIASASREQSGEIHQISTALQQVDRATRLNMEQVGQVAEKARNLIDQTGRLGQVMGRFSLGRSRPVASYALTKRSAADMGVLPYPVSHSAAPQLVVKT